MKREDKNARESGFPGVQNRGTRNGGRPGFRYEPFRPLVVTYVVTRLQSARHVLRHDFFRGQRGGTG